VRAVVAGSIVFPALHRREHRRRLWQSCPPPRPRRRSLRPRKPPAAAARLHRQFREQRSDAARAVRRRGRIYAASPGGKKVCFALARQSSTSPPNRPAIRPGWPFTTRPEKVKDEVSSSSVTDKPNSDAHFERSAGGSMWWIPRQTAWVKCRGGSKLCREVMRRPDHGQPRPPRGPSAPMPTLPSKGLSLGTRYKAGSVEC
jgi:hypothetical protein